MDAYDDYENNKLKLHWPDDCDENVYCYVDIWISLEDFNIEEYPFTSKEEEILYTFIKKYGIDKKEVLDMISIGTED